MLHAHCTLSNTSTMLVLLCVHIQVVVILLADAFTTPLLRVCNIYDFLLRKVVAPRMTTQADMNVFYQGVEVRCFHDVQSV
jgi:hypothetical protein